MKSLTSLLFILFLFVSNIHSQDSKFEILILGAAQDGAYPQINCTNEKCCEKARRGEVEGSYATSIAIINKETNSLWLVDCGPDFKDQFELLNEHFNNEPWLIEGIFLTHAHIGHYTGLIQFGREVISYDSMDVYVMPRMKSFLSNNGPWDQLVRLNNIVLKDLENESAVQVDEGLGITPFLVPHRDEYSETVGFRISSQSKSLLFIPDIDKWHLWEKSIRDEVKKSDYALLDATFYGDNDHPDRSLDSIPHPSVKESILTLNSLSKKEKEGVHFIHMNHTNPLFQESEEFQFIRSEGYGVAKQGMILEL